MTYARMLELTGWIASFLPLPLPFSPLCTVLCITSQLKSIFNWNQSKAEHRAIILWAQSQGFLSNWKACLFDLQKTLHHINFSSRVESSTFLNERCLCVCVSLIHSPASIHFNLQWSYKRCHCACTHAHTHTCSNDTAVSRHSKPPKQKLNEFFSNSLVEVATGRVHLFPFDEFFFSK